MALIETVDTIKRFLAINNSKRDEEIDSWIEACLADAARCGIELDEYEPNSLATIKLYCKGMFVDDTNKAQFYFDRYDEQKKSLMLKRYGE